MGREQTVENRSRDREYGADSGQVAAHPDTVESGESPLFGGVGGTRWTAPATVARQRMVSRIVSSGSRLEGSPSPMFGRGHLLRSDGRRGCLRVEAILDGPEDEARIGSRERGLARYRIFRRRVRLTRMTRDV